MTHEHDETGARDAAPTQGRGDEPGPGGPDWLLPLILVVVALLAIGGVLATRALGLWSAPRQTAPADTSSAPATAVSIPSPDTSAMEPRV